MPPVKSSKEKDHVLKRVSCDRGKTYFVYVKQYVWSISNSNSNNINNNNNNSNNNSNNNNNNSNKCTANNITTDNDNNNPLFTSHKVRSLRGDCSTNRGHLENY